MPTNTYVAAKSGTATNKEALELFSTLTHEFGHDKHIVVSSIPAEGKYYVECLTRDSSLVFQRARELTRA